jgi:hypothetical protein
MKAFIEQCLRDQEAINGIRQLYYLETDTDGKRKLEITILGILKTCEQFPYIPEQAQQKIIREQMVKDQDYDALNSRTVWKWLNQNKDLWWAKSQEPVPEVKDAGPLSPETEKLIRDWQVSLLNGIGKERPLFKERLADEMAKIKEEDKSRLEGKEIAKSESFKYQTDEAALRMQELRREYGVTCCDLHTGRPLPDKPQTFELWLETQV